MLAAGPWVHKEQGGARISSSNTGHPGKAPETNRDVVPEVCTLTTTQHPPQLLYSYFTPTMLTLCSTFLLPSPSVPACH